jgi:hypothetical protein
MPYTQIELEACVDPLIRRLVRDRVDLYLGDVHAMLRLPRAELGIAAACNFAIAEILCAVISGLSRIFVPSVRKSGDAFVAVLCEYPIASEPHGISLTDFGTRLYTVYRCNVVHSLGINVDWSKEQQRQVIKPLGEVKIRRECVSMSEEDLQALESETRPAWLGSTIDLEGRTFRLNVEALYWGVRRLTRTLANSPPYSVDARAMLALANPEYGLSLMGGPGPSYQSSHEISATAVAVTSLAPPDLTLRTDTK